MNETRSRPAARAFAQLSDPIGNTAAGRRLQMHIYEKTIQRECIARALENWDDDGGAPGRNAMHSEYRRRIESDGPWTIHDVCTGSPAKIGGHLTRTMKAADSMSQMAQINADKGRLRDAASRCGALSLRRWYEMHIW